MSPSVGISLMPQSGFREAVAPLFAAGLVEAVEWTIDIGFGRTLPAFVEAILDAFSASGHLYGHGTGYSPLGPDDPAWRDRATDTLARRPYRHLTEHFGFCAGGEFTFGPPLPVPRDGAFVRLGRAKLSRLRDAGDGRILLTLRRPRRDGTTELAFTPRELLSYKGLYLLSHIIQEKDFVSLAEYKECGALQALQRKNLNKLKLSA